MDILDPDELVIKFIRPELIEDAETGDRLEIDADFLFYKQLPIQITEDQL